MRQIISTAVVAVIVGALAGATMSAVAQAPAEQAITPAAGINAASVDGKSAVGYTNKKNVRRGKLVATNKVGELPSNIVRPFWGYIKNKPGILADDQIAWGEVMGTPAGFADGVDDKGVTGLRLTTVSDSVSVPADGQLAGKRVDCPGGAMVTGGGFLKSVDPDVSITASSSVDADSWYVEAVNNGSSVKSITAFAQCLSVTPSEALKAASK